MIEFKDFSDRLRRIISKEVYLLIDSCKPELDADIKEENTEKDYWMHIHIFKARRKSRVWETLRLLENAFISGYERKKRAEEDRNLSRKRKEGVSLESLFKD